MITGTVTISRKLLLFAALFPLALVLGLLAVYASSNDVGFQREDKSGFNCPYFRASLDAGEITFQEYVDAGCS